MSIEFRTTTGFGKVGKNERRRGHGNARFAEVKTNCIPFSQKAVKGLFFGSEYIVFKQKHVLER